MESRSCHAGDRSLVSNYRPISLVSCVDKVFQRIIFINVYNYLVDNSLIYKHWLGAYRTNALYSGHIFVRFNDLEDVFT